MSTPVYVQASTDEDAHSAAPVALEPKAIAPAGTPGKPAVHDIMWSNVNFSVGDKKILSDCWGSVPTGNVCAILGPSGAGKSSLLNVLAGRSASTNNIQIDGTVRVGNQTINPVKFRKHIAYVMQDDALMATSTPREALLFSATMRLPPSTPKETLDALVEKMLTDLGIMECADVYIGGPLLKGISGGQRKRTSVGVEVITDPALLFLDEPTSGLDSHSACNLVKLLKTIASNNSAILCTIHQPSSEVFALFDLVIFMKAGRIFYQGPVSKINTYYADLDHKCPENYNPADFVMNLCQSLSGDELERVFMPVPGEYLADAGSSQRRENEVVEFQVQSSFFKQFTQLAYREAIGTKRNVTALYVRFGITTLLNILYGLIFLGAGGKDNGNSKNFNAHVGAIMMAIIYSMFGSAQPIMLAFPFERPMFMREYTTGTYTTTAYLMSKLLVEVPVTIVQMMYQWMIVYFMMDLQGNYFQLAASAFGLAMTSNSLAMILGAGLSDVKEVTELSSLLFVPQILFAGFFIRLNQIPIFLRW
eukprot:CAMPEP_0170435268 /NCGR_PEP_ID=MMETSP0117_2-20130122/43508_1 /TAXON_ID=400756 /ORGANISM="Durinskia baltica, Strain CSIRO CS-38" /LENGTH=533 /DNA_ID=CAMNT_0010695207 /DNA_START=62 /DNA_END=1660 /DNA_ORIENTATION=-